MVRQRIQSDTKLQTIAITQIRVVLGFSSLALGQNVMSRCRFYFLQTFCPSQSCSCTPQGECFRGQQDIFLHNCLLRDHHRLAEYRFEGKVVNMAGLETEANIADVCLSVGNP